MNFLSYVDRGLYRKGTGGGDGGGDEGFKLGVMVGWERDVAGRTDVEGPGTLAERGVLMGGVVARVEYFGHLMHSQQGK